MNGQGYYKTHSGYCYEGLFENGYPKNMAAKLAIQIENHDNSQKLKMYEGKHFLNVRVLATDENDQLFTGKLLTINFIM